MTGKWVPLAFVAAALVFMSIDFAYHYGRLPAQIASHFDARGHADGWSSKTQFIGIAVATVTSVLATLISLLILASYVPPNLINLPNKEYWLAPERLAETRWAIAEWGLWFVAATLWLLVLVFHEAMAANLRQPPRMHAVWWLLGGYLAFVLCLILQLLVRFSRIPKEWTTVH